MVSKEDCIEAINKFIKSKDIKDSAILFQYLCDIKEIKEEENIKMVCSNPILLSLIIGHTLEELERALSINRITDKNHNLIIVF